MKILQNGNVTTPSGYLASGVSAGLKRNNALDVALIKSVVPAICAGAFTNNSFAAAPVIYCKSICEKKTKISAIITNSGNANSCTGKQGIQDSNLMAKLTAPKPWNLQ